MKRWVEIDEATMVMEEAAMVTNDEKTIVCFYHRLLKGKIVYIIKNIRDGFLVRFLIILYFVVIQPNFF